MQMTLSELLGVLELETLGPNDFEGTQPDPPNHHIVGGQLAAQALMAASHTVPGRPPHSLHVYFLERGDTRRPVSFEITRLRDGGTFSVRRIVASQDGRALAEVLASFTAGAEGADYQGEMPEVPPPDALVPVEVQLAPYAAEYGGWWVDEQPFDTRYVGAPPRVAMDTPDAAHAESSIWFRARGSVPADPVVNSCLLTYLSALTLSQPALGPMGRSPMDVSALLDHTVWFHRPAGFADWLLYEQKSPTGIAGRALATGAMYDVAGGRVCTASQEVYFPVPKV